MKDKKIFSANRSVKFPLFMIFILFVALIIFIATSAYSDEDDSNKKCDELIEWIVDGNDKSHAQLATYALNIVSIECLGREADPTNKRPVPRSVLDAFMGAMRSIGI